jgi:hypothetical protein
MSAKRKATPSKRNWQAMRARYTWHLDSPFDKKFDHSHWWNGQAEVEPEAALYELARRHPLVNETPPEKISLPGVSAPTLPSFLEPRPSLRLTQRLGMKSWPKLTALERRNWKSSIGRMKGFDLRPKEARCMNITKAAHSAIMQQRQDALRTGAEYVKELCGLGWLGSFTNPTDHEWEMAIVQQAIEAHRQGKILLAVAPNLTADKVNSETSQIYREFSKLSPSTQPLQRARRADWLPIISEFEDMVMANGKWSQIFARYRRVLDGIRFT